MPRQCFVTGIVKMLRHCSGPPNPFVTAASNPTLRVSTSIVSIPYVYFQPMTSEGSRWACSLLLRTLTRLYTLVIHCYTGKPLAGAQVATSCFRGIIIFLSFLILLQKNHSWSKRVYRLHLRARIWQGLNTCRGHRKQLQTPNVPEDASVVASTLGLDDVRLSVEYINPFPPYCQLLSFIHVLSSPRQCICL